MSCRLLATAFFSYNLLLTTYNSPAYHKIYNRFHYITILRHPFSQEICGVKINNKHKQKNKLKCQLLNGRLILYTAK
jgi:hypothetical protein